MKKNNKLETLLYIGVIILFIVLTTIISFRHEYWADEANAWLIARDGSFIGLITRYLALNGHPIGFITIIKLFQLIGLSYHNFHLVSILFSTLGITIFLFKSPYKWYLKLLLPFTFFIFYQYTIITRGYCLLLFLFSLLATIWSKRKEHYFFFTCLLIILTNLESYTFLIAGSIYLLELIEFFKNIKESKKDKKRIICSILLFLSFLFTTIYMFPKGNGATILAAKDLNIADAFIYSHSMPKFISIITTVIIIGITIYIYLKNKMKKELLETIIIFTPVYLFFQFLYCNYWHAGILLILFLFVIWIHNLDSHKLINGLLLVTCIVQIFWSVKSSINDYKYIFSPTEKVADFIKEYDYKNIKIFGKNYLCSAINPYFNENIFALWPKDIAFYLESKNNPNDLFSYEIEDILIENPDIFIISNSFDEKTNKESQEKYKQLETHYELHTFKGHYFFEDYNLKDFSYDVYVKKDLQQIKN